MASEEMLKPHMPPHIPPSCACDHVLTVTPPNVSQQEQRKPRAAPAKEPIKEPVQPPVVVGLQQVESP